MVVVERLILTLPVGSCEPEPPAVNAAAMVLLPKVPVVAEVPLVVEIDAPTIERVVAPEGAMTTTPSTSQSPAVKLIEVMFAEVPLERDTGEPEAWVARTY